MNNLVLITSVICTTNNPLSYTNNRSVYSHEERFEQTKKTIESIINAVNPKLEEKVYDCSSNDIEHVKNVNNLQNSDKFDVVFFHYFFGKSAYFLEKQKNVLIESDNTSYILLQQAIKMLKNGINMGKKQ